MKYRVFTTFLIFVLLLTAGYGVLIVLPFGDDLSLVQKASAAPPFSGGDGSKNNPYQIINVSQLQNMSTDLSAHYLLISDVDASETKTWNGGLGFSPIANDTNVSQILFQGTEFSGSLDGQGYNITNLYINRPNEDFIALFGMISISSKIENVNLIDCTMIGDYCVSGFGFVNAGHIANCTVSGTINGTGGYIGGLTGYCDTGTILNCKSNCNLNGTGNYIGGLSGGTSGLVKDCVFSGIVNGTGNNIGGLIGIAGIKVINCTSFGKINSAGESVGGLIGYAINIDVSNSSSYCDVFGIGVNLGGLIGNKAGVGVVGNCTAFGTINASGSNSDFIGGLIGENTGMVNNCTSYGTVNGFSSDSDFIGGLIGDNSDTGIITNCSAYGKVTGVDEQIGGLLGRSQGSVKYCYSLGNVMGNDYVGGLIGEIADGKVENCSAYGNVNGNVQVGGIAGRNDRLVINCRAYGNVTGNEYVGGLIGRTDQQGRVNNCHSDVTIVGTGIDNKYFGGLMGLNFKGIITNCSSNSTINTTGGSNSRDIGGLLGVNDEGTVSNCSSNVIMNETGYTVGGLIGGNYLGKVSSCISHGIVNGTNFIGGLLGRNTGDLENCSSYCTITGESYTGGAIGYNDGGNIKNCYSRGSVSGISDVGGLIGNNTVGTVVKHCYSAGKVVGTINVGGLIGGGVGKLSSCFWDNITSGQSTSVGGAGVIGKNTTDMMRMKTFTNAGWDFINIWGIIEGKSYPFFRSWYNPPVILTQDLDPATEDLQYNLKLEAYISSYPHYNKIKTWSLATDADSWLDIDNNGNLFGIPSNADVGSYWVNVTIIDFMGGNTSHNYTLIIINVNDPPDIITTILNNATEDVYYFVEFDANDIDPTFDILTWNITSNAKWLLIDNVTANISGTPSNEYVGTYLVNVSVSDGIGGFASHNYTLNVTNINDPPSITTTDNTTATEDQLYQVDYEAEDIDPTMDTLNWNLETNSNWLDIDSNTGLLSGTPENADVGNWWVNVTVDDDNDGINWHNFTITVSNVNDPPDIQPIELVDAVEDSLFTLNFDASDIDPTIDTLTWSLNTDAEWISLNLTTGLLSGTPKNIDVGTFWLNLSVDDGNSGSDWTNFTLTVLNVNDPPMIETDFIGIATSTKLYSVDYEASDIDPTNDTLKWLLKTNATWISLDPSTGVLSGTPKESEVGSYWVNVTVSDGNGGMDWQNFTLKVQSSTSLNKDPLITTPDVLTATAGKEYSVEYTATDDRTLTDEFVWSMSTNAGWLKFNTTTNTLYGVPQDKDLGSYWVNISVSDGEGGFALTNFTLKVIKSVQPGENKKPELTDGKMTPSTGDTDTEFTFTVTYTDADNESGEVYVWIDGKQHKMSPDLSDTDYTDGVEYTFETKLSEGSHDYYFTASDGTDAATPKDSTPNTAVDTNSTPKIEKVEEKDDNLMMYIFLIIALIIIVLLIAFALSRRKKEPVEDEEDMEEAKDEEEEEEALECPECGAELGASESVCPECGAEFEEDEEEELEDEELEDEELEEEEPIDEELDEEELSEEELEDEEIEEDKFEE